MVKRKKEKMSETKQLTREQILSESSAIRITMSILFSAIREQIMFYMYDAKQKDKQEVNKLKKAMNKVFSQFDKERVDDNTHYESLVEKFQTHGEDLLKGDSYEDRRDLFAAYLAVGDHLSKSYLNLVVGVDKYIVHQFYIAIRVAARHFTKDAPQVQKDYAKEIFNHFLERKKETEDILLQISNLNKEEDGVS